VLAGIAIWVLLGAAACAQVSLYTAVDLALSNSNKVRIAEADQSRARGALMETHDAYIPNFSIGAGLGYSYGFPLGNPTLFNVQSQSLLFSSAQKDYVRSARAALKATTFSLKDARQQVIFDTSSTYLELDKTNRQIAALKEAMNDADQLISIVENRVAAGMDSRVAMTRARLTRAQMHLQQMQLEDHAEELRQHLANLTGLPADSITADARSVPALPDLDIDTMSKPAPQNPAVQAAFATAESSMYTAFGDEHQKYRPTVESYMQYSRFSNFNNYNQYYLNFQQNNFGIGFQATFPIFDPTRKAKAIESSAAAAHTRHQAEQARIEINEQDAALWHSLKELQAEEDVAKLKQELAKDTLDSVLTQMQNGSGAANTPAVTPKQAEQSRIDERLSYIDMLSADFAVERAQLGLLRVTGGLENWAKGQP
jgi:outer membrane protein TolC